MKKDEPTLDLAPVGETGVVQASQPTLMNILHEAVQRGADVAVIERLVALKERVDRNEAEKAFYDAKYKLHAKLPQIEQSGRVMVRGSLRSRYARYEDIDVIIRPLLEEFGFSIDFDGQRMEGQNLIMTATLAHSLGHKETKTLPIPFDKTVAEFGNSTQAMKSTVSYGKRTLVEMLLNIIERGVDDDANMGRNQAISDEQVMTIETLIKDTKSDLAGFLRFIGADSVKQIRVGDYAKALAALEKKRK